MRIDLFILFIYAFYVIARYVDLTFYDFFSY